MSKVIGNTLPPEFFEQFKPENLNQVDDPVKPPGPLDEFTLPSAPKKEVEQGDGSSAVSPSGDEDFDPIKGFEDAGESALTASEANEFAELLVDGVALLKDGISEAFSHRFEKAIEGAFSEDKRQFLNVVIACDQEEGLSIDKLKGLAAKLELDFMKLLEVKVAYVKIKERWQASEYKQYQKDGIKRNAKRVAEKYFANSAPDPLAMLAAYVGVALGGDMLRIGTNIVKDKKQNNGTA